MLYESKSHFVESELLRYGPDIILESIELKSRESTHYSYISNSLTTKGIILKLVLKNHSKGKNVYISIYNAGQISDGSALNKDQFREIQNGTYKGSPSLLLGFNIEESLLKKWRSFLKKSTESANIQFPWMSVLSTMMNKALRSVSNEKSDLQYFSTEDKSKLFVKFNQKFLQGLHDNACFDTNMPNIQSNDLVDIEKVIKACFTSANDVYDILENSLNKNKISMRSATRFLTDYKSYWVSSLGDENLPDISGKRFDDAVHLSKEVINVASGLHSIMEKITKCADNGVKIINDVNDKDKYHSDNTKLKIKAAIIARQKALMCARTLYAQCLRQVMHSLQLVEKGMRMFGAYDNNRFLEFAKECDSLMDTCLYSQLNTVINAKEQLTSDNSEWKDQSNLLASRKAESVATAQMQKLVLFVLEAESKIAQTCADIENIFSNLVDDPSQINDVEKYIIDFMSRVRNYTSYNDLETNNLLKQTQEIAQMRENIANFMSKEFGIAIFNDNSNDSSSNMKRVVADHTTIITQNNEQSSMDIDEAFEILLKERYENKESSVFVLRHEKFCLAKSNSGDKRDTHDEFSQMVEDKSFVPKGAKVENIQSASVISQVFGVWNTAKEKATDVAYGAMNKITSYFSADDRLQKLSKTEESYHPGVDSTHKSLTTEYIPIS